MAGKRGWYDDDTMWRDLEPHLFPEASFRAAARNLPALLEIAKPKGRSALDLCCGPGRYTIPLARKRFRVTAVDRTRYFLDRGRARARRAGVRVEWVRADMRDYVRPDTYDLALSMFTSFGYFEDEAENFTVLRNLHECLRPGGVLVMELMGKEVLARIWQSSSVSDADDGSTLINRRWIRDDWTRIRNEWVLLRGRAVKTFRFDLTLYSGKELSDLLRDAGFASVRLYGSVDGGPYDLKAMRLVAVARKRSGRGSRA